MRKPSNLVSAIIFLALLLTFFIGLPVLLRLKTTNINIPLIGISFGNLNQIEVPLPIPAGSIITAHQIHLFDSAFGQNFRLQSAIAKLLLLGGAIENSRLADGSGQLIFISMAKHISNVPDPSLSKLIVRLNNKQLVLALRDSGELFAFSSKNGSSPVNLQNRTVLYRYPATYFKTESSRETVTGS